MSEERKTMLLNKDVERGNYAWKCVDEVESLEGKEDFKIKKEDYRSYAKKFPIMVLTNGFSHAMAFAFSKGFEIKKENKDSERDKKEKREVDKDNIKVKTWGLLFFHIVKWLNPEVRNINPVEAKEIYEHCMKFMNHMLDKGADNSRFYEEEALSILNWIRRIADGRIGGGEG